MNTIQSQFSIGEKVTVSFRSNDTTMKFSATITAIHFTTSKVKYDVEIKFAEEESTRIHNIDSLFIHPAD